jgi:hypothetical protein
VYWYGNEDRRPRRQWIEVGDRDVTARLHSRIGCDTLSGILVSASCYSADLREACVVLASPVLTVGYCKRTPVLVLDV